MSATALPGRERDALAGVDLELAAGELVLLAGPSGSGKTTLLRALCGLVPHFHGGRFGGRCRVAGLDTRHARPAEICARAGHRLPGSRGRHDHARGRSRGRLPARVRRLAAGARSPSACSAGADRGRRRAPAGAADRPSSRAASCSASRSPRRSRPTRRCCCSTSRCRSSIRARPASLAARLRALADAGACVVVDRAPHRADRRARRPHRAAGSRPHRRRRAGRVTTAAAATNGHQRRADAVTPLAELREIAAGFPGRTVLAGRRARARAPAA